MRHSSWSWLLLLAWVSFAVACSASPEPFGRDSTGGKGGTEGGAGSGAQDVDGGAGEGGQGGEGGQSGTGGQGGTGVIGCQPQSCADLGKECGFVSDGCGDVVDCGACKDGELCGIAAHNECTAPASLCEPLSKADACNGKACGITGDGCSGTHDCGTCAQGFSCGLEQAFACGEVPVSTPDTCTALITSCASVGAECGLIGNGCGGTIDCTAELGACAQGTFCGLLEPQKCGAPPACTPLTPEQACPGKCGLVSNGCAPTGSDTGLIDCSAIPTYQCPAGQGCGAGGIANQCGDASNGSCQTVPLATACGSAECGLASNGCDGSHMCGTCGASELCSNGSCVPTCTPTPMATACAGKECGSVSNGCSGSYSCGTCATNEKCGQETAFQCDLTPPMGCVPLTNAVACAGKQCGTVYTGCGASIDCATVNGGCGSGEFCGIQTPFQCDAPELPACTPAMTCADLPGWECGTAIDECGNPVPGCGTCDAATETCIGGITGPTTCQQGTGGPGSGGCDVCPGIPTCTAPAETVLTGRVVTPGKSDGDSANQVGVPNAFVYILANNDVADLPALTSGIPKDGSTWLEACDRCDDQDLGPVLNSATTNATGAFTLSGNIPVNRPFVLVVKIGKWRRAVQYTVPTEDECGTHELPRTATRLPRTRTDGLGDKADIPRIAISTGRVDAMECVFHKLGVATSEFALPGDNGDAAARIHMYASENDRGAVMAGGYTGDNVLHGSSDRLNSYDLVVFDCERAAYDEGNTREQRVREYVNRGGRMFASHYAYTWIRDNGTQDYSASTAHNTRLSTSANWGDSTFPNSGTGYVSVNRSGANASKIPTFANWLLNEGAVTQSGADYTFAITDPRDHVTSVNAGAEEWVYRFTDTSDGSCGTCTGASQAVCEASSNCTWSGGACSAVNTCAGRSWTSCNNAAGCDWSSGSCRTGTPSCSTSSQNTCNGRYGCAWTAGQPTNPTVQQYSFNTPYSAPEEAICGRVAYSGFHVAGAAGDDSFTDDVFPTHCEGSGANNGNLTAQEKVLLYMLFDLSSCVTTGGPPEPPVCNALDPVDACVGRCGTLPLGCGETTTCDACPEGEYCGADNLCTPAGCIELEDCGTQGATCGTIADGCGGTVSCGNCQPGQECGLFTPNQCAPTCTPIAMQTACSGKCGYVGDGCGGAYQCPDCGNGQVCINNMCTTGLCTPITSCPQGKNCGVISDGCDGTVNCGNCVLPQVCGGGGQANVCGQPMCMPLDCQDLSADCGFIGDGCGGAEDCGDCQTGQVCGLGGANKCGGCEPRECSDLGAECGQIGDGCGAAVDCGDCPAGQICGAVTPNKCGNGPSCTPLTCKGVSAECGLIGDGCGGVVDCGDCIATQVCGLVSPNQCNAPPDCQPQSCADVNAECGSIGDGCGALVDCGPCPAGKLCGLTAPNRCTGID